MPNHQYLALGQDVIFVGPDKQEHKAKITVIYSDDSARVEWSNGSAVADYSDKGAENTFHFEQASPEGGTKKK
jgi:hypothetical protein